MRRHRRNCGVVPGESPEPFSIDAACDVIDARRFDAPQKSAPNIYADGANAGLPPAAGLGI
jgi:hypothetical protein